MTARPAADDRIYDPDVRSVIVAMRERHIVSLRANGIDLSRRSLESISRTGHSRRSLPRSRRPSRPCTRTDLHPHSTPTRAAPTALVWSHGGGTIMDSIDSSIPFARGRGGGRCCGPQRRYHLAPEPLYPVAHDESSARCAGSTSAPNSWVWILLASVSVFDVDVDCAGGLAAATALPARNENGPHLAQQVLAYPGPERRRDRPTFRHYHRRSRYADMQTHSMTVWRTTAGDGKRRAHWSLFDSRMRTDAAPRTRAHPLAVT
ncbi:alpha/beta hydrolase fold domain-containing protein [Rhodococcus sp. 7Tela_A2]|uniref:alpha/beta hydrolase fold domain-containing protein n=1 Tax=Rhodococcus sp. 7Tela_A2 TaxID=3093744 RepID=UPI003BB62884